MPVTKSAKKKLRQDIKRTLRNRAYKKRLKGLLKKVREKSSLENVKKAQSFIDKAAKKKIIHKNKAARLKNKIFKLLPKKVGRQKKKKTKSRKTPKIKKS